MEEKYQSMLTGTINLDHKTSSAKIIVANATKLYERIINSKLLIRRITITACNVVNETIAKKEKNYEQIDLFTNYEEAGKNKQKEEKEKELQKAVIGIKSKYGKNAILKGMNFEEAGTMRERNKQVGGHKA